MALKYNDRVHEFSKRNIFNPDGSLPEFTFATNPKKGRNFISFFLRFLVPFACYFLRKFWPNPRFGKIVIVTRRKDIEYVLDNKNLEFPVPYKPEMLQLGGGGSNILAEDGEEHLRIRTALMQQFKASDIEKLAKTVSDDANALLDSAYGKIDVIKDLITRTATEASCQFIGLYPSNPEEFAHWSMAVSNQLFGDPKLEVKNWEQAQIGAAHLRALIRSSIDRIHYNNKKRRDQGLEITRQRVTLIDRLVTDAKMSDEEIIGTVIGMLTAFVPTGTLATGNMLEIIMTKPKLLKKAKLAAKTNNRNLMRNIALEAGRIHPALNPGLWRLVSKSTKIGKRTVRPGDAILVVIPSGLRDKTFTNPERVKPDAWLMFGAGPHECLGDELSLAHITSVFMALFSRDNLKVSSGKYSSPYKIGAFHDRWEFTYDYLKPRGGHVVMTFPVREGLQRDVVRNRILDRIGNPAKDDIRKTFWKTEDIEDNDFGRVQFSSLSVVELEPGSNKSIIIFELNGDGDPNSLIDYVSQKCDNWLRPILHDFVVDGNSIDWDKDLSKFLKKHINKLHFKPWGSTGLLFEGLPGLSVKDIYLNDKIATAARKIIDQYLQLGYYKLELKAAHILRRTKRVLVRDNLLMLRRHWRKILNDKEFDIHKKDLEIAPSRSAIIRPSRSQLPLTDFTPWKKMIEPAPKLLTSSSNSLIWFFALLGFFLLWISIKFVSRSGWTLTLFISGLMFVPILLLAVLLLKLKLNKLENSDLVDSDPASKIHIEKIAELEDPTGHQHNHIIAVMPFKKGVFRRMTFSFTMWSIFQTIKHWFRPGFVVTMGSIHVARWFRIKGTNIFAFLSNYDGSWESYLEDFITRANQGQSAAWSHGVGFPRTKNLIEMGAADGDNFKRWVRKQQRETLFWYSRFPDMTTEQIRRDAMIVEGLSKSVSDTDAKRWLSFFGSEQRQSRELETQEIQSLVFTGFPKQILATSLLFKLPDDSENISEYLKALAGIEIDLGRSRPRLTKFTLPPNGRIRFSNDPVTNGGVAFGLTSAGCLKAGLKNTGAEKSFPYAFQVGMAKRAKVLGDDEHSQKKWRFTDNAEMPQGAEAILMIYGNEAGSSHTKLVNEHLRLIEFLNGKLIHKIPCKPVKVENPNSKRDRKISSLKHEHFGFRDGISQPVIQTSMNTKKIPERDIVAPGEFILGYQNHQGYTAPPITLGSIFDIEQTLSNFSPDKSNDFPYFGYSSPIESQRDFGRNGFYLAVRQLDQDVDGFNEEMERVAENLKANYRNVDQVAGDKLNGKWVAAKIIGRWQDGTPLVGNRTCPLNIPIEETPNNDFTYGLDDPRGHACPLGSHIRRTNPRDSMEPGNHEEQLITNRHRLLRRGRSYEYNVSTKENGVSQKKGLLFMSVCGDLERQFEFVQRTWINKTSFHGLKGEYDPLLGGDFNNREVTGNSYTIPTPSGPLKIPDLKSFVTLQGGGYFFMPSRASLAFLINKSG